MLIKSYLENGYVKASLKYFFAFFKFINSKNDKWTKDETILALALYCKIPFSKIHKNNPQIIELSKLIGGASGNMCDVYICMLRKKIDDQFGVKLIYTVRGKGYMIK